MRTCTIFIIALFGVFLIPESSLWGEPDSDPLNRNEIQSLYPESFLPKLRELIEPLESTSPPMIIERLRIDEARNDVTVARADRLPRIFADIQLNVTIEDRDDFEDLIVRQRPVNRISASQPLYHWNSLKSRQEIAELEVENTQLSYERSLKELQQRVRQAYFQLLEREYSLELAKKRLESAERFLERQQLAHELGDASKSDLLRAEFRMKNEQGRVYNETQALESVRFRLFEQTGIRMEPFEDIESNIDQFLSMRIEGLETTEDPDSLKDESLLILRNQVRQQEHSYVIEKSRNRPRFDVVLSVFQDEITGRDQEGITRNNVFVGFRMVWDIFRGGDGKARRKNALSRRNRLIQSLKMSDNKLSREYRFLIDRIKQTVRFLKARQDQIDTMEELYRQRRTEYEQGRVIEDELLDDRINLDNSKLAFVRLFTDLFLLQAQVADLISTTYKYPELNPVKDFP